MRSATLAVRQFLALVEGVDHQDAGRVGERVSVAAQAISVRTDRPLLEWRP